MAPRNLGDSTPLRSDHATGVTPPLLPTLVVAVLLAGASLLCREPVAPAPQPAPVEAAAIEAAPVGTLAEGVPEAVFVPATLAFTSQFPLILEARAEPAHRAGKPAVAKIATVKLAEPRAPGVAKASPPVETTPSVTASTEVTPEAEEGLLPDLALPFGPAVRAVVQVGTVAETFVGTQRAALGSRTRALGTAMAGLVERLR